MRRLLAVLFVVGLVAAPTFGQATMQVEMRVSPATVAVGQTATVEGWFMCTGTAVAAIGGNVVATGTGGLSVTGALTPDPFYVANFRGFQPGTPTAIPPAAAVAGANGGVNGIGSAQPVTDMTQGWNTTATYGNGTFVKLFSYQVTATAVGTVTLTWADVVGGYNGWYTTDTSMNNYVVSSTPATLTITQPSVQFVSQFPAYNATYKCGIMNRTARNVMELTFSGNLPSTLPVAGTQIKIYEMAAGAAGTVTGADLSANFDFSFLNATTLKCKEKAGAPALTNRKWYVVQITGWAGVADTTTQAKFGLLRGDGDRSGRTQSADVTAALSKVSLTTRPDESPEGAYDFDGNGRVQSADVTACLSFVSLTALPVAPW